MVFINREESPPAMNGCEYTVKIERGTWRCMTEEQYRAFDVKNDMMLPLWIGSVFLFLLALAFVVSVYSWFRSPNRWLI